MNADITTHAIMMARVSTLKEDFNASVPTDTRDAIALVMHNFY